MRQIRELLGPRKPQAPGTVRRVILPASQSGRLRPRGDGQAESVRAEITGASQVQVLVHLSDRKPNEAGSMKTPNTGDPPSVWQVAVLHTEPGWGHRQDPGRDWRSALNEPHSWSPENAAWLGTTYSVWFPGQPGSPVTQKLAFGDCAEPLKRLTLSVSLSSAI